MSTIKEFLDQMLSEAELAAKEGTQVAEPAGGYMKSSARPADKSGSLPAKEGTAINEPAAGQGGSTKRSADKSGSLPAKEGTDAWAPTVSDETGKYANAEDTVIPEQDESDYGSASKRGAAAMAARIKAKDEEKREAREERKKMDEETLAGLVEFKVDLETLKGLMETLELNEEFQSKAVELIEAAVTVIAGSHVQKINEAAAELIEAAIDEEVAQLEEEAAQYLDHVVAEWVEENQVAIQSSIRTEIAESFMDGLKGLLEAHNVDLPEEKVDLYNTALEEGQKITDMYEAEVQKNAELVEQLRSMEKARVVESVVVGMTATQAEKVRSLSESIEFDAEETFVEKLKTLSEGYVKAKTESTLTEDAEPVQTEVVVEEFKDPEIAALAKQVARWSGR